MTKEERQEAERQWTTGTHPEALCKVLGSLVYQDGLQVSQRKWRLFVVSCLRRVWHVFNDERNRGLVEATEQFADEAITEEELGRLWTQAADPPNKDAHDPSGELLPAEFSAYCASEALAIAGSSTVLEYEAYTAAAWARDASANPELEAQAQVQILRDLFNNPFRSISIDTNWFTAPVTALARDMYADRSFETLPVLADSLKVAGCDNADILTHCRGPGPHVRGCWVVDLILGKS